jgi:hypothetical protein
MGFLVPNDSTQKAIDATAAFFVFGFGAAGNVAPWTVDANIFRRNGSSGTQSMTAAALALNNADWHGTDTGGAGAMITQVTNKAGTPDAESTLGILSQTDYVLASTALVHKMRFLAFEHFHQTAAYYPSSTDTAKDLANVRDGHYAIWGPLHVIAPVTPGTATIVSPRGTDVANIMSQVVSYVTGQTPPPGGVDLIQTEASAALVPQCAMKVKRGTEMGPYQLNKVNDPCNCYYDKQATGMTSCTGCRVAGDCAAGFTCVKTGFCEAVAQ